MTAHDWSQVASGWERESDGVEELKAPLSKRMLEHLALRPGDRVLELGCGTGALARRLAGLVAPGGTVLATDVASGMVEVARRALTGVSGVSVAEVDAATTDLPEASFDAIVFRMGLMFVEEPLVAVKEARRVLAEGGRYAAAVWSGPQDNPWLSCVGMAAMMSGLVQGGPPVRPGEVFSLTDSDQLRSFGTDAGFAHVDVEAVDLAVTFPSADHHFEHVRALAGPLATMLAAADDVQLAQVRATAADLAARFHTDVGIVFPAKALLLTAC